MKIEEFELKKNKHSPEMCYSYVKKEDDIKYTIFTMNGGKELLLSIEIKRLDGRYYTEYEYRYFSIKECLDDIKTWKDPK